MPARRNCSRLSQRSRLSVVPGATMSPIHKGTAAGHRAFAFDMTWHFSIVTYGIWSFGNPLNVKATALDVIGFLFLLMMT